MAYTDFKKSIYDYIVTLVNGSCSVYQREVDENAGFPYMEILFNGFGEATDNIRDFLELEINLYCEGDTGTIDNLMVTLNNGLHNSLYNNPANTKEFARLIKSFMGEIPNNEYNIFRNQLTYLIKIQLKE